MYSCVFSSNMSSMTTAVLPPMLQEGTSTPFIYAQISVEYMCPATSPFAANAVTDSKRNIEAAKMTNNAFFIAFYLPLNEI